MQRNGQTQQAESSQPRNAAHFQRLLEVLPAAAYTTDAEGLVTSFNQRALELWGRQPKVNDAIDRY